MVTLRQLLESEIKGKSFIIVDIQPEYEKSIWFLPRFIDFLNQNHEDARNITFLYNGAETLGMINEQDYQMWWIENGLEENIVDSAYFYDKGYAFFRYCMDSGLDDDVTVNFVRFMWDNNVHDSRDMDRDMWAKYLRQYRKTDRKEAFELLHRSGDCVHIPDLMDYLQRYNNITLCGGGMEECLREVELALRALDKPYSILNQFVY